MAKATAYRAIIPPAIRGTLLGSALGILPGGGPVLASFSAYSLEKKVARDPSRFGRGAIEGVAGPEAANESAAAQTSFIPMLTRALPSNATMAFMIGALMMQGLHAGPQLMRDRPELFWGLVASMWVGNVMLVILNLPLVGIWAKFLTIPYRFLCPAILLITCVGVYSINTSAIDVLLACLFGFAGYMFNRLECEPAPLLLGLILGPMIEENLRRALLISHGSPAVFVQRPISLTFLIMSVALIVCPGSADGSVDAWTGIPGVGLTGLAAPLWTCSGGPFPRLSPFLLPTLMLPRWWIRQWRRQEPNSRYQRRHAQRRHHRESPCESAQRVLEPSKHQGESDGSEVTQQVDEPEQRAHGFDGGGPGCQVK